MMNFNVENNVLVIFLSGRVDSSNADSVGAEFEKILSENSHGSLIFDAENLEYISSAGLRVVLKVKKKEAEMKIVNASAEVYDIFDMTGFTEMIKVEKAYKKLSVEGCKVIGEGAKGVVYRYNGDTVVKVYKNADSLPDIKKERELARRAFVLGIPTAISYDVVKVGESYGSVFELLDAKSYSELIKENKEKCDEYIAEVAELLRRIHTTQVEKDDMPDVKIVINRWLKYSQPYLKETTTEKIRKMIDETPDTLNMLHCDFHTNNIMSQNGEILLIDMDTLSHGYPVFELANIYAAYVGFGEVYPVQVEKFIGLSYETAGYVWKNLLAGYLQTDDAARIKEVENKVRLLWYIRYIQHVARREDVSKEESEKLVSYSCKQAENLIDSVDTFVF